MMYTGELNYSVTMNFTLHTEPNASVPEFTISCRTHEGPATTVQWTVNGSRVQEDRYATEEVGPTTVKSL